MVSNGLRCTRVSVCVCKTNKYTGFFRISLHIHAASLQNIPLQIRDVCTHRSALRKQDTSCHVLIQLMWNPKYPCTFVLVYLDFHPSYVTYNPHSAYYKQLHCVLEAFGGMKDHGN